jgi:hypothetical protein
MAKQERETKMKNEKERRKTKKEEDRELSKELEMSFPASDPPSATQPGGGITGPEVATSDKGGEGSKKPARPS